MGDGAGKDNRFSMVRTIPVCVAAALLCLFLVLLLSLKVYIATPHCASRLSRLLSDYLHQGVTVSAIATTGGGIHLTGLSLANPAGFPNGNLVTAASLTIVPRWGALLRGRQGFDLIALEGITLDLQKNDSGSWNYSGLQQRLLAGRKPATRETVINRLVIRDGALRVNGQGAKGLSLTILNLATLGTADSGVDLSFEDTALNRYRVTGTVRPGSDPAFDLALNAPSLSLAPLAGMLPLNARPLVAQGRVNLQVKGGLHKGLLRVATTMGFTRFSLPVGARTLPLAGSLAVTAEYDLQSDQARIQALTLGINDLLKLVLTGTVRDLRHERSFSARIGMEPIDLRTLAALLPENEHKRTIITGTLGEMEINLAGDAAHGITGATGALRLRGGAVTRDGRQLVDALEGTTRLSRDTSRIRINGALDMTAPHGKPLLEAIRAPFSITLSHRLRLLMAEIPSLSATISGIPITGHLGFTASAATPFTASLRIPATPVSTLQPLFDRFNLRLTGGSGAVSLTAAGEGARAFSATTHVRLAGVQGSHGTARYALRQGDITARIDRKNQTVTAAGDLDVAGVTVGTRVGEARFSYRFADGTVTVDNASFRLGTISAAIASLAARIPRLQPRPDAIAYPLFLDITGAEIRQGEAVVSGITGSVRGGYVAATGARWLEGGADVAAGRILWQGKAVGSPAARIAFSPSGARVMLTGELLGGALNGDISFNPFAPAAGGGGAIPPGGQATPAGQGRRISPPADTGHRYRRSAERPLERRLFRQAGAFRGV